MTEIFLNLDFQLVEMGNIFGLVGLLEGVVGLGFVSVIGSLVVVVVAFVVGDVVVG
jgi:hypothetical protein